MTCKQCWHNAARILRHPRLPRDVSNDVFAIDTPSVLAATAQTGYTRNDMSAILAAQASQSRSSLSASPWRWRPQRRHRCFQKALASARGTAPSTSPPWPRLPIRRGALRVPAAAEEAAAPPGPPPGTMPGFCCWAPGEVAVVLGGDGESHKDKSADSMYGYRMEPSYGW